MSDYESEEEDIDLPFYGLKETPVVSFDFTQEVGSQKKMASHYKMLLEEYLKQIQLRTGMTVDERVANYLKIVASALPLNAMIIGQSPYNATILPFFSSAFAFDTSKCNGITPSVQILSQFINLYTITEKWKTIYLLANSHLLLVRGILCINSRPIVTSNIVHSSMLDSLTADFVSGILKLNFSFSRRKVHVFKLGMEAKTMFESSLDSIDKKTRSTMNLTSYDLEHPASLSRKLERSEKGEGSDLNAQDPVFVKQARERSASAWRKVSTGLKIKSGKTKRPIRSMYNVWADVEYHALKKLGKKSASIELANLVTTLEPNDCLQSFILLVQASGVVFHRTMSSADKDRKRNVSEKDNYLITTLKRINVTCDEIKKRMDKLVPELRKFMKKYPDVVSQEEVELFKQNVAETRKQYVTSLSLLLSSAFTLTQGNAAISINQSRVAPLLRIDEDRITSESEEDSDSESSDSDSTESSDSSSESSGKRRRGKSSKAKAKTKASSKKSKGGKSPTKEKKKRATSSESESETTSSEGETASESASTEESSSEEQKPRNKGKQPVRQPQKKPASNTVEKKKGKNSSGRSVSDLLAFVNSSSSKAPTLNPPVAIAKSKLGKEKIEESSPLESSFINLSSPSTVPRSDAEDDSFSSSVLVKIPSKKDSDTIPPAISTKEEGNKSTAPTPTPSDSILSPAASVSSEKGKMQQDRKKKK